MDKKTQGAWLLHHARKLQATTNQDFDSIAFAGKSGTLLSAISAERQSVVTQQRLEALARANHISPKTELPAIVAELARQKLILPGSGGVEVLGLTGHSVLEHTSRIFDESSHEAHEEAVIFVSEIASETPTTDKAIAEVVSDNLKLSRKEVGDTLDLATNIGFFDSEPISAQEKLLFNGNLFRRDDARKVNAILSTLKAPEAALLTEVNQKLQETGCLPLETVNRILGQDLFARLHSIGLFDVSVVGNDQGKSYFVTRPAAFSKFSNSIADDALDLAKALVASLTYGMTVSSYYRGRIQMVSALMNKLIAGHSVGPATAIGSDYQALELKGVVAVTPADNGMFSMRLLKPEVGRLALAVIEDGDITAESVSHIPGARITEYIAPELNREVQRKNATEAVKLKARNLLQEIRTGGLKR
ncbi:TPA: hypothetical protein P6N12_002652 [Pseudomonas aeruginosa]|uniref:Uncharacterized protein n=3 Tax=Gammaproteobacteria TaxID=1236 RepID=A0A6Y2Z7C7_SALET|nr:MULTISPECIES: hypothetical protein [Gammaproteobacteria]EBB7772622.1 hypothetical protein [Salmonella enterica subsp. enterica serovar Tennessee]EBF6272158.1 hypothetical protein [Salmonella enterica]MBK80365.1 hypothetical protein [Gammaproteobacteria bacterium]HAB4785920.1 hypothetical protein [Salmonella enterica subsp. enterica serovar Agona]AYW76355.1 hypothetical protein EGV95_17410 [Pseudomonas aeruginosa]